MTAEQDGLDPADLAAIREDDARLVSQLPPRPEPPRWDLAHVEHPQTTLIRLSVDRRALLVEVDRLAALTLDLQGKVARVEALTTPTSIVPCATECGFCGGAETCDALAPLRTYVYTDELRAALADPNPAAREEN